MASRSCPGNWKGLILWLFAFNLPVKAIDGCAANELDEAKVQDWKVVIIAPIHSEIISQSWIKAVQEELTSIMVVGFVIFVVFHNN